MYFSDKIKLIHTRETKDADGFPTVKRYKKTQWADIQTATRSEFYTAQSAGYDIAFVAVTKSYNGQKLIEYKNKEYTVTRTARKGRGDWVLICSDMKNG